MSLDSLTLAQLRRELIADEDSPVPISRAEAKAQGLDRYFTGKPCQVGHIAERRVNNCSCVACESRKNRLRYERDAQKWRAYHREKMREDREVRKKEGRSRYQENPEKYRERARRSYHKSPEQSRARSIRWRKANPEKMRACQSNWMQRNPDKVLAMRKTAFHRRRARKRNAEGSFKTTDIERIYRRQKGLCAEPACRKHLNYNYQIDHIIPLSRGGSNWPKNLQCLCPRCNALKWNKDPVAWAQENGRLL